MKTRYIILAWFLVCIGLLLLPLAGFSQSVPQNVQKSGGNLTAGFTAGNGITIQASGTGVINATKVNGTTFPTSFAVGDLLYASGANALSKLADVAVGSVLVSGGVTTAPAYSATPQVTRLGIGGAADANRALYILQPNNSNVANIVASYSGYAGSILKFGTTDAASSSFYFFSCAGGVNPDGTGGTNVITFYGDGTIGTPHFATSATGINSTPIGATTASTGAFTTITASDTTDSSSTTTGSVHTAGGLGVAKKSFFGSTMVITANAAALPAPFSGTLLQIGGADATTARLWIDSFGSSPFANFRRADGTNASPTAVQTNDVIGGFSAFGYGATGYSASGRAGFNFIATQNWTDTAQGAQVTITVCANGSVSPVTGLSVNQDASATVTAGLTIGSATLITTTTSFTNGAAAAAGTLLNAPTAGNPTKWIPVVDNGTTRYIPAW